MADIQDFIKMAAQNLGESEGSTGAATGALLGVLKEKVAAGDFQQLLGAIPGAANIVDTGSEKESGGGGLLGALGGLTSSLGGGLGGGLGGALGILTEIQKTGFSASSIGPLVSMFLNFTKSNAGEGLVQKLLGQIPELAKLGGS